VPRKTETPEARALRLGRELLVAHNRAIDALEGLKKVRDELTLVAARPPLKVAAAPAETTPAGGPTDAR
jgi:hypothetical protein